ncbi:MAG: phosphoribosylamine--glycine ligase [Candidatus Omnitrophica bacterium]|nr:phosphoribosylamine--glycine ligase [Candidatus Omnitrophota bacterium]MDD5429823.1 phosphoribosylamine--glycine ligase [Candidatus Omnitrophota bacterium]
MKVLVVGSGGREHCLAWKLSQSTLVNEIYCAPGNGGTKESFHNINISADNVSGLLNFALKEKIGLTVVGPEVSLAAGIVDEFENRNLAIFGPTKDLALLEASKVFSKQTMLKFGLPTADFEIFTNPQKAKEYIINCEYPLVVKADGLAAGKGVVVCQTENQAKEVIDMMMVEKKFGSAADKIIIEKFIAGREVSILAFTDGETILPLVASQDHKRAYENDRGPNTGGMGAYAPSALFDNALLKETMDRIFKPLIHGLRKEGKIYKGILYAGLMIKDLRPYVLEFNVRFGDPETQAILPKLKSDLADVMLRIIGGRLSEVGLAWDDRFCLCVVLASGGYPGKYEKNKMIKGLDEFKNTKDILIFHAGTELIQDPASNTQSFLTKGGRVLNVAGLDSIPSKAQAKVYAAIDRINFGGMFYRKDIGNGAL